MPRIEWYSRDMIVHAFEPSPALAPFVECLWYAERHGGSHPRERTLPTGTVELVFDLSESRIHIYSDDADRDGQYLPGAVVCGPHSGYFVIDTARPKQIAGVHFRPGGAAMLLGIPVDELANRHIALEDLWGSSAATLRMRLAEARDAANTIAILQRALETRLGGPMAHHPAIAHALSRLSITPSLARISQVREETGYSAKRFIALFRDSVGLTPKLFCRVRRFQDVIARLARGEPVEWADVAVDCGFYDQPHLNREFRAFSGITPTQYRPVTA